MKLSVIMLIACHVFCMTSCTRKKADRESRLSSDPRESERLERELWKKRMLADPATGEIPPGIRNRELAFAAGLPVFGNAKRAEDIWKMRGPSNQGGRTRAFGIDLDNPGVMLAGSATGGIYKSTDGGHVWRKTTCPANSITCMLQDSRPGKRNIWYAGTGELYGSSGSGGGAYYSGQGILKSTDGGETWSVLPSTSGTSTTVFDSDFDGIWNLALDASNTTEDEIYAATYGGIYKSVNGGTTWKKKRSGTAGVYSYCTDVAVTSDGTVYATLSSESSQRGIWRSTDGETWTAITPAGFPASYDRMCIGIAPSDERQVYIVATGTDNEGFKSTDFLGRVEWNSLWKYDYISGNGSGSGGRWVNRSANMPDKGGDFGYYNTQQGYDLFIRVKPNDTNVVFIGATNLWRSTDAFRTNTRIAWIGGYAVNTSRPDFKLYPNHHPDNHHLVFMPGSSTAAFSTHDGGISYTGDIMAEEVVWQDRSNGYITSQFYTVTIDRGLSGDQKVMGGTQDNGTLYMNGYGKGSWHLTYNGDGAYGRFRSGTAEIVASAQQGRIARLETDSIGRPLRYARIDPAQLNRNSYDFINPFVIDPFNASLMYLPANRRLFRNTDISAKPLSSNFDSTRWNTPLWEELTQCVPPTGHAISAISISEADPNTLFYGTDFGKLYRVRNAHTGQPSPQDISGPAFGTGYINCIALDPLDSGRITVVFSNYGVISLFTSTDGGSTWQSIAGNLEQNPNGSGSGPSCRWAAVMRLANGNNCWFVGTSVGLFATDTLNGAQTRWIRQSPQGIGNNIVTMIDVRRQDYTVAVATHGNGVYSANIGSPWQITGLGDVPEMNAIAVWPNPVSGPGLNVILPPGHSATLSAGLMDMNGRTIAELRRTDNGENGHSATFSVAGIPAGIYFLQVRDGNRKHIRKVMLSGL